MKQMLTIGFLWVLMALAACNPSAEVAEHGRSEEGPNPELSAIDSLMWRQPDSALAVLQQFAASPKADSLDELNGHYCQLLISELLYKNDYGQSNRPALQQAVRYFDSLSLCIGVVRNVSTIAFLDARAHYINGAGYYECDSVVEACKEYLKALEVMEGRFEEKDLVKHKAQFLNYIYNRLGDLFEDQLLAEPAITCYNQALFYCRREPTSIYGIPVLLYRLGIQYNIIGQIDSAAFYYDDALANMPDFDNLHYRDLMVNKTLFDYYNLNYNSDSLIEGLKQLVELSADDEEKTTRLLTLGNILFEEKQYDSSRVYLETVFEQQEDISSKIMAAEYLCNIYQIEGDSIKAQKYASFLVGYTMSEIEKKIVASKVNEMFKDYLAQKQEKKSEIEREKSVKKVKSIIIPTAVVVLLAVIIVLMLRNKKQLKIQQEEADRILVETEQAHEKELRLWQAEADKTLEETKKRHEEELRQLKAETEQRLEEVEMKHQQWMAETKERHTEELRMQKNRSEREIEKTKKRHVKELESERLAYRTEQEALRKSFKRQEERVKELETKHEHLHSEVVQQGFAFSNEPICRKIKDSISDLHLTARSNYGDYYFVKLDETDSVALGEAVARHFPDFRTTLRTLLPKMDSKDLLMCYLYLLHLNNQQIAVLQQCHNSTIHRRSEQLQKDLKTDVPLPEFVRNLAFGHA